MRWPLRRIMRIRAGHRLQGRRSFHPDTMLFEELPLASLQLYELVVDLETKYDLHISDEAIEKVQTIDDVVEMISFAKS